MRHFADNVVRCLVTASLLLSLLPAVPASAAPFGHPGYQTEAPTLTPEPASETPPPAPVEETEQPAATETPLPTDTATVPAEEPTSPPETAIPLPTETATVLPVDSPVPTETALPPDTATPLPTDTATPIDTASPPPTETPTLLPTETPILETATPTVTVPLTPTATLAPTPAPGQVSLRLTVEPAEVSPGGLVTVTLTLSNPGRLDMTGLIINTPLPAGLSYYSPLGPVQPGYNPLLQLLAWTLPPELATKDSVSLGYTALVIETASPQALSLLAEASTPAGLVASDQMSLLVTVPLARPPAVTPAPKPNRVPAGPPARLVMKAARPVLPADGQSQTAIAIWVTDARGEPVAEASSVEIRLQGAAGQLVETDLLTHDGLAVTRFVAGTQPGRVTLTARAGGITADLEVTLTPGQGRAVTAGDEASIQADLARLGAELRYALAPAENGYQAESGRYRAVFGADGEITFNSRPGQSRRPEAGLSFRLTGVSLGQASLYQAGPRSLEANGNVATYQDQAFRELYQAIAGGVEQFFIFDRPPHGRFGPGDDLVIEGTFKTNLQGQVISNQAGIVFYPAGQSRGKSEAGHLVYTGARVRDNDGRETYAEISLRGDRLRLTVPGQWLVGAEYPLVIDPLIGDPAIISDPPGAASAAAAAYNGSSQEYLVLWQESQTGGGADLYGRRVQPDGTVLANRLEISLAEGDQTHPALAYNSQNNEYLAVWEDTRNGVPLDLYGQRLDQGGSPLGSPFIVAAATLTSGHRAPALAYNSTDNTYLLAWNTYTSTTDLDDQVYAQVILATGALSGTAVAVSPAGSEQAAPGLAYDSGNNRFLVAWQDGRNSSFDIYGRLVQANGQPLGNELLLESNGNDQFTPEVAYTPGQYLVAWRHHLSGDNFAVRALRLTSAGSLQGSIFDVISPVYGTHGHFGLASNGVDKYLVGWDKGVGAGDIHSRLVLPDGSTGTEVTLADYEVDQLFPVIAYSPTSNTFLLAWEDHRLDRQLIYGQRVDGSGSKLGDNFSLSRSLLTRSNPVVAANGADLARPFLAVWEENRGTTDDLYGQWLTGQGTVTGSPLLIADSAGDEDDPAVAYNAGAGQYLVVWQSDAGGQGDDIYAQRVDANGLVGSVMSLATAGGDQRYPRLAYNSQAGEWLVVWIDEGNNRQINVQRVFSDGAFSAATPLAFAEVSQVDVAYSATTNEYLIVWQRWHEEVWFQRVGAGGQPLGSAQKINSPTIQNEDVSVSFHQEAERYLVVWTTDVSVRAQQISGDGTLFGNIITLYPGVPSESQSVVVYDAGARQNLVAWRSWGAYETIRGTRVNGAGNLVGNVETLADLSWDLGAGHPQLAYHPGLARSLLVWRQANNEIYAQPYAISYADFTADPLVGPLPLTVTFNNLSQMSDTYGWDFGDGGSSTAISPTHVYSQAGVYTVTLTAGNGLVTDTLTRTGYITVTDPSLPVPDFMGWPLVGSAPLTVTFTNNSQNATDYVWAYGDGITSTIPAPTHVYTYSLPGLYTVTLSAANASATVALTRSGYISVTNPVRAAFSAFPTSGPAPLAVQFFDNSTGAESYLWDFGDTLTSTQSSPSHTYSQPGVYTVTLQAFTGPYSDTAERVAYIQVADPQAGLQAYWPLDETGGTRYDSSPNGYHLTDNNTVASGPGKLNLAADLERDSNEYFSLTGGPVLTGSLTLAGWFKAESFNNYQTLLSRYRDSAGKRAYWLHFADGKTPKLTLYESSGSYSLSGQTMITLATWYHIAATFDASTGRMALYLNGALDVERLVNVSQLHHADVPLLLGAYGSSGGAAYGRFDGLLDEWRIYDRALDQAEIEALIEETEPVASFSADPLTGMPPLAVTFTNSSANATDYIWDYGDGITSTIAAATHIYTYTQAGVYTITLTAANDAITNSLSLPAYITVTQPLIADFSAFPTSGQAPLMVQFFDNSTGAESYLWNFGDTLTSTQSSPSHTYTLPGVYTVTLTVAGSGPSDTLTRPGYITVTAPITADFSAEPLAGPAPLTVTFSNSSTNATQYVWNYGDGITSTIAATSHVYTYTQAGVYTVTLTAAGPEGSDTLTRTGYITVTDSPIDGLVAINDSPTLLGETTTLTVTTSAGSNVSYDWAFGDGQSGSGAVVTHTYSQAGHYTAVVTASNPASVVTATTAVTITGAAGLAISKTAPSTAMAGEPVTYTLTITNSGAGPAANLLITDTLPISSYYVSGGDLAGDVISWTVPSLAGGEAISVTFTVTAATTITNSDYAVTADGGISAVGQEAVTTEIYPPIVPDFSAEPLSGTVPLTVTFVNSTTGASTYLWDYGDGITSTITATNHVYTYTQAGVYTVTLWAGNGAITVPLTRPAYITVTGLITRDWQMITTATTLPPVVGEHGLAYDSARNRAILYGGNATGWPYENTTWEFDGTDWISVTTTTTPAARYGAGLAYDNGSGSTILFGGSDETDTALAQTWTYSSTDWALASPSTSPSARVYPAMTAAPIGTVYLFGGNDAETYYDDLWQYDSGDWNLLPAGSEVPQARTLAALAYDSTNGQLLLFGGRSVTGTVLADFWEYNFSVSSWNPIDDPGGGPPARMAHSLTYDAQTGTTVLVGGVAVDGETVLTDTWHYNGGWTEAVPSASPSRPAYHQAVYRDNAIILVSDGEVWKYE